jgi:hypothetical protein
MNRGGVHPLHPQMNGASQLIDGVPLHAAFIGAD